MVNFDIKEVQHTEFEILCAIRDLCEHNGLVYYLGCGTLLGAVRHRGFIPWDDDVDLLMPYEDYQKFLKIAPEELGEEFFLQTCDTDPNYYCAYAKVRRNDTTMMRSNQTKYQIHQGVWCDIFPLIPAGSPRHFKFSKYLLKVGNLLLMDGYVKACRKDFEDEFSKTTMFLLDALLALPRRFREHLHAGIVKHLASAPASGMVTYIWNSLEAPFSAAVLEGPRTELEFEHQLFRVPPQYHAYLTAEYGDYLTPPPEQERGGHGDLIVDVHRSYTQYIEPLCGKS